MGLFALGTAPGLLSIGGVTSLVRGAFKERFFKVAGQAIIFFALFNLNNGYTLAGFNLGGLNNKYSNQENIINDPNVTLEDGVQVVRMIENNNGYSPNKFSIQKCTPVKWIIEAKAPYSCASVILIPKLKIQKFLSAGENVVEFTPTESGALPFSCSMGMYTGVFNVYDSGEPVSANSPVKKITNVALAAGGGGCGCGGGRKQPANPNSAPVIAQATKDSDNQEDIQIIKTAYTEAKFLNPSVFKVKAGTKVRLEIDVRDSGSGCGYAITIPGLYDRVIPLKAGVPIIMEFTPTTPDSYEITCSMHMINYGSVIVE